jgi:hypothetical protein
LSLIRAFTPVFAGYAKPINIADGFREELNPSYKTNLGSTMLPLRAASPTVAALGGRGKTI